MATTLDLVMNIASNNTKAADVVANLAVSAPISAAILRSFADGSAANQISKRYVDTNTLAGSGSQSYDLDAPLVDELGQNLTFTALKIILVEHKTTSLASGISVGGDFMTTRFGASALIPLVPGGVFLHICPNAAGLAVVASTGDQITVTNLDGAVNATYDIILGGI